MCDVSLMTQTNACAHIVSRGWCTPLGMSMQQHRMKGQWGFDGAVGCAVGCALWIMCARSGLCWCVWLSWSCSEWVSGCLD